MKSFRKLFRAGLASFIAYLGYYVYRVNKNPKEMGSLSETMEKDAKTLKDKLTHFKWEAMDDKE